MASRDITCFECKTAVQKANLDFFNSQVICQRFLQTRCMQLIPQKSMKLHAEV